MGNARGWDERELLGWFEAAGFSGIEVSYELMTGRGRPNQEHAVLRGSRATGLGDRADLSATGHLPPLGRGRVKKVSFR